MNSAGILEADFQACADFWVRSGGPDTDLDDLSTAPGVRDRAIVVGRRGDTWHFLHTGQHHDARNGQAFGPPMTALWTGVFRT